MLGAVTLSCIDSLSMPCLHPHFHAIVPRYSCQKIALSPDISGKTGISKLSTKSSQQHEGYTSFSQPLHRHHTVEGFLQNLSNPRDSWGLSLIFILSAPLHNHLSGPFIGRIKVWLHTHAITTQGSLTPSHSPTTKSYSTAISRSPSDLA
jgi:hypothetical protein